MAQKTSGTLVALGTAAVTAIYMTGYLATAGASAALDPTAVPVVAQRPTATVVAAAAAPTRPIPLPTATIGATGSATRATYRDGTYSGAGTSRRGGFEVAVTVQGGRIASVALTRVTTEYPASRIAGLPAQVVARQSAKVDRVSGATYSVQAFTQAVAAALAKAAA